MIFLAFNFVGRDFPGVVAISFLLAEEEEVKRLLVCCLWMCG